MARPQQASARREKLGRVSGRHHDDAYVRIPVGAILDVSSWKRTYLLGFLLLSSAIPGSVVPAQESGAAGPQRATIVGTVQDVERSSPIAGALVTLEGTRLNTLSDSAGAFRLREVPAGPQVLHVRRIGYAPVRTPLVIPVSGVVRRDIVMAQAALLLAGVIVTADPVGRARGELGTASVIDREAIAAQIAPSIGALLELVPGTPLSVPGLEGVQQASLRAAPNATGAGDLAAFGTLIVLDGVPLSNNANLQTTGPRGEQSVGSSAGGGVDLRRIPATTVERLEVIRGIPSSRYGDLTQGTIVIDTRTGAIPPELLVRYDPFTVEASVVGGTELGRGDPHGNVVRGAAHAFSGALDVARTRVQPGLLDDDVLRVAADMAHRWTTGRGDQEGADDRFALDSRLRFFQLHQNSPERPEVAPGRASSNRDNGMRLTERLRWLASGGLRVELTASIDRQRQRSTRQALLFRPAMPFTDRLTEGRAFGRFIEGLYLGRFALSGDPWLVYSRLEGEIAGDRLGLTHRVRAGAELRREWTGGPGYEFAVEFPPQSTFNGINGFDRPRRFDAVPAVATSALYVDDQMLRTFSSGASLSAQLGLRIDALHEGTSWLAAPRSAVVQPRLNVQLAPWPRLRFRGGAGRTAKLPSLIHLSPAPQYFDLVNVNWYPPNPAERLAVLTTFIRDPANASLGYSVGRKLEAGFEVDLGTSGATMSMVGFFDVIAGAVGFRPETDFILREHYRLSDSTVGTGRPPAIVEPPSSIDTVPIIIDRPANNQRLASRGIEWSATLPEIPGVRIRVQVQGAWIVTRLSNRDVNFGPATLFTEFQGDSTVDRVPYWLGLESRGERALMTTRVVHHQPALGLIVTATVQNVLLEESRELGAVDTLAFSGYVTRTGALVPVARERRSDAEFADLRRTRAGVLVAPRPAPADWLLSLQVAKTLPGDGRLSFYAFNALNRVGKYARGTGLLPRLYPEVRFGLEVTLSLASLGR